MLYSALLVGLLGSIHCLGMCGPLALALPVRKGGHWQALSGRLLYNAGRILTYSLMGWVMGSLGWGMAFSTSQQHLSIAMAALLLVLWWMPTRITSRLSPLSALARFTARIRGRFSYLLQLRSYQALFLLGLLNGLLPCGLVYVALAGAVATGSGPPGMASMALFGLGTLPMMWVVSLASQWISAARRAWLTRFTPTFTLLVAFLLIIRG
jgi:sulfite exporter TauE/SafE